MYINNIQGMSIQLYHDIRLWGKVNGGSYEGERGVQCRDVPVAAGSRDTSPINKYLEIHDRDLADNNVSAPIYSLATVNNLLTTLDRIKLFKPLRRSRWV